MLKQVLSVLWESNACLEHFFLEITELGFRHLLLLEQYIPVIDSLTLSIDYIETDEGSKQLPAGFFRVSTLCYAPISPLTLNPIRRGSMNIQSSFANYGNMTTQVGTFETSPSNDARLAVNVNCLGT